MTDIEQRLRTRIDRLLAGPIVPNSTLLMMAWAVSMAFILSVIVYYGFTTNYTINSFSVETFSNQYKNTIYRYRILSPFLLIEVYNFLKVILGEISPSPRVLLLDAAGNELFYHAYFVLNTLGMMAFALAWVWLVRSPWVQFTVREQWSSLLLVLFLATITQYVVTPYDQVGYFLHTIGLLLSLQVVYRRSKIALLGLALWIGLATLNRESSALILSALLAIQWHYRLTISQIIRQLTIPVLGFLAAYIMLRIFLKGDYPVYEYLTFWENFKHFGSYTGILFNSLILLYFAVSWVKPANLPAFWIHIIASFPYILMCVVVGYWFETRLFVPIFLTSIIIGNLRPRE